MEEIKILLVDDEAEFVKTLTERIQIRGLEASFVLSGEAALEALIESQPDVMVLDLKMPGLQGMEVLRRVKRLYPDVQVLILTGHGADKDEEEARRIGAFEYLKKPVDIETLIQTVRQAYEQRSDSVV